MNSAFQTILLVNIHKTFGPLQALAGVDFSLQAGEVHALLGENGAGKTTLMKILYGLIAPDRGEIRLGDKRVTMDTPAAAIRAGLGFVQQHFSLVESLAVAENVVLGRMEKFFYRPRRLAQEIQQFIDAAGFELDARAPVAELSVGEKQRVEIIKTLYRKAHFVLLDEPTSVLAPAEIETLFRLIARLREQGKGIVLITHKLQEALDLADRITVLRQGRRIRTLPRAEATLNKLAELMMGEKPRRETSPAGATIPDRPRQQEILQADNLVVLNDKKRPAVRQVSLRAGSHEIVGIAGVDGNGQRELAEALVHLRRVVSGRVRWHILAGSARCIDRRVLGYLPQDRAREGVVAEFTVAENAFLEISAAPEFRRYGFLRWKKIRRRAQRIVREFAVACDGPDQITAALSGGNQQKLLVGRVLSNRPVALVAVNPTWGVDIRASAAIRRELLRMRDRGGAIVLISTDLDEIYELCDRFYVMYRGRFVGEGTRATPLRQVGLWMAGMKGRAA